MSNKTKDELYADKDYCKLATEHYHLKQEMDRMEHGYEYAAIRVEWRTADCLRLMENLLAFVNESEKGTLPPGIDLRLYTRLLAEKTIEHLELIEKFNKNRKG